MKQAVFIFALSVISTLGSSQNNSKEIDSMVDEIVKPFVSAKSHVGLSVSFYYDDKRYFYNYGVADKSKNIPTTNKTIFEIGSITKTFAGLILAQAVEDKKVNLDDDVRKYLNDSYPNLEYKGSSIKLYHLLNHSSGLPFDYIDRSKFQNASPDSLPWLVSKLEGAYTKEQLYKDLHTTKIDTVRVLN